MHLCRNGKVHDKTFTFASFLQKLQILKIILEQEVFTILGLNFNVQIF